MSIFNSDLGTEKILEVIRNRKAHIHFIGVLGAGMLPLAELLSGRGLFVSGTDRDTEREGILIPEGIVIRSITEGELPDIAVYTLALDAEDAELVFAREREVPCVSRAELLGALMLEYPVRIGVAGTHGKSTVTAVFDALFSSAGIEHTTISGAKLPSGSALYVGGDEAFIFEACEYKNSFLSMHPTVAVITNIELDHADFFHSEEEIYSSFERWGSYASELVIIGEGKYSSRLSKLIGGRAYVYGNTEACDVRYYNVGFSDTGMDFSVSIRGVELGDFSISTYGEHNVKNATAAIAYASVTGIPMDRVRSALEGFCGIERRLELLGTIGERAVYYDYAHHPTEIYSTLSTLKSMHKSVTVIFRPHTYSRTAALFSDFVKTLSVADSVILLGIYPAREEPIEGVTASALADSIGHRAVSLNANEAVNYCLHNTKGAIVLMGAGEVDIPKLRLLEKINEEKQNKSI